MSNDTLVNEALSLGGVKVWEPQGFLTVYKLSTQGAWQGKVVTLTLSFYSPKELGNAVQWAIVNGYTPEQPRASNGNGQSTIKPTDVYAPVCPTHNKALINKGHGYFCPSKMPDGSWCKYKVK